MDYPVTNEAYDLLSMLQKKLEALEVYDRYDKDMHGDDKKLLEQIRADDKKHAQMLSNALEMMARDGGILKR